MLEKSFNFIVTRGLPGAGKSTFIKNTFPIITVVCPDEIRLKENGLDINEDGIQTISQANPFKIWKIVFDNIKEKLYKKENVILDATSTRPADLKKYKKLAESFGAKFIIIDFSDISIDICKERNKNRLPEYKRVADNIIDKMAEALALPLNEDLSRYIIKSNEFNEDTLNDILQ